MSIDFNYKPSDKMCNLIARNHALLSVLTRFGISLGFREKTIKEICEEQKIDCQTFLSIINFLENQYGIERYNYKQGICMDTIIKYLKESHIYFLDYYLPLLRQKLEESLSNDAAESEDFKSIVLLYFDKYVTEVHHHMQYEDKYVFTYVSNLVKGKPTGNYSIIKFAQKHNDIGLKLSELKNIIIKYYPFNSVNNKLNDTLSEIFRCEYELAQHCKMEDYLFTPAVAELENKLNK